MSAIIDTLRLLKQSLILLSNQFYFYLCTWRVRLDRRKNERVPEENIQVVQVDI